MKKGREGEGGGDTEGERKQRRGKGRKGRGIEENKEGRGKKGKGESREGEKRGSWKGSILPIPSGILSGQRIYQRRFECDK